MERLAGRVILLWGWRRLVVALLAGALLALTMPPLDFPAAGFLSFPLLVWLLEGEPDGAMPRSRRWRSGFGVGWWFGFGYFLAGLFWIGNALMVEADLFGWAVPLAVIGLPALLAVFFGIATLVARRLWSGGVGRVLALAFAFGLVEWLRSFVLTGFPWNAIGYAAMPVPLMMQSVTLVGLFGMTALAVFVFCLPAMLVERRDRRLGVALALIIVAAHLGYGAWRLSDPIDGETLAVRIVQPSIAQSSKWDEARRDEIFATLIDLTNQPAIEDGTDPRLILWPETAFPFLLSERPDTLAAIADVLSDEQSLMAGAVRIEPPTQTQPGRFYNSVLTFNGTGEIVDGFDKIHLVPFGEYVPLAPVLQRLGLGPVASAFPSFSAGTQDRLIETGQGIKALAYICYEAIFPAYVGDDLENGALLVNVTNDAWFGVSPGPYQHLRQAQLRAVEAGRPMLRAANNGLSAAFDARGQLVDGFAFNAVGALDVALPMGRLDASPSAARWAGLALIVLLGAISLALHIRSAGKLH